MPSLCNAVVQKVSEGVENRPPSSTGSISDDVSGIRTCITLVEKKVRNMEKRKSKLDDYKERITKGQELIKDQKDALEKYEIVVQNLEFAHEMQKQFQALVVDAEKQARKQARREKIQRHQENLCRMVDLIKVQNILSYLSEENMQEVLQNGSNFSLSLTPDDLTELKSFKDCVEPVSLCDEGYEGKVQKSAEHLLSYLDGDSSAETKGPAKLKSIISQIMSSRCFAKTQIRPAAEAEVSESCTESNKDIGSWADQVEAQVESKVEDKTAKVENVSEKVDNSTDVTVKSSSTTEDKAFSQAHPTTTAVNLSQSLPVMNDSAIVQVIPYPPAINSDATSDINQFQQQNSSIQPHPTQTHHIGNTAQHLTNGSQHVPHTATPHLPFSGPLVSHEHYSQSLFSSNIHNSVPQQQPRVKDVREIVSAIQGNYDFLQDSVIEATENPNDDSSFPCVRTDDVTSQLNELPSSTVAPSHSIHPHMSYHHPGAYIPVPYHAPVTCGPAYFHSNPQSLPVTTGYMTYNSSLMSGAGFIPPFTTSHTQFYTNEAQPGIDSHPVTSQPVMFIPQPAGEFQNHAVTFASNSVPVASDPASQLSEVNVSSQAAAEQEESQMGRQFTMNPNASEFKSKLSSPEASESGDGAAPLADAEAASNDSVQNNHSSENGNNENQSNPREGSNFGRYGPNRGFSRGRPPFNNSRGRGGYQRYHPANRQQEGFDDSQRNNGQQKEFDDEPRNNFRGNGFRGNWNENRRNNGGRGGPRGRGDYGGGYRQNFRSQQQQNA